MSTQHGWKRQVAVAGIALGFVATVANPVVARPAPKGAEEDCPQYGELVEAPAGMIPRDDHINVHKDPLDDWVEAHPELAAEAADLEAGETVTIPVAFHVIRKSDGGLGDVPQKQVADQMDVLNESFAGSGFEFHLDETTRTTAPQWFNLLSTQGAAPRFLRGSSKEIKMKRALHEGDAETLNIYTADLAGGLLGWAYMPWDFNGPEGQVLPRYFDGVVLDYRTLPGGAYGEFYGQGDTGVHEVGHWMGLFHTFDGGCGPEGDLVADTPAEAIPAFECEVGRDTCPDDPGTDPVKNFMDYTYDSCMDHFTDGQEERMRTVWASDRS